MQTWDKPRRPSPAIMLTGFLKGAKELAGYLLLILLTTFFKRRSAGSDGNDEKKFPILLVAFLAGMFIIVFQKFIEWYFTRYWVEGDKLVLTKGMLVKKRIELPLQKIQTIQLHQNMMHRLTGTSAVTMDTAGSENTEFEIEAIRTGDAQDLQQWVRSRQRNWQAPLKRSDHAAPHFLLSLGFTEFAKLCISENHLKSLALIAIFILGKVVDISQQFGFDSRGYISKQSSEFTLTFFSAGILLSIALVIAILFSSIRVMLRFYDYRLQQTKVAYEMGWGLFTRHRKTMPFEKVEFLTWWSNWLRQKMHLYVLRLHSLAESETEQAMQIQLPVTNRKMLSHISGTYIPELPADSGTQPAGIAKVYVYRKVLLVGLPLTMIVGTIAWFYTGWHACWVLLWLIYFAFSQYTFYKNYRIWITEDAIQISRGIWGREQVVIYLHKIVSVTLHTSPYQRNNGYANLALHLPGKSWVIPYLPREQADYWADYITLKMEA
jgi:putative membrane protein